MGNEVVGPLVTTDWLAENLERPDVKVVDTIFWMPGLDRILADEYELAHIPGSLLFDIDAVSDTASEIPHMMPSPARFAELVGLMGIRNTDTIICADRMGTMAAPRAWWMFRSFGHDAVAVLDGGITKWMRETRPVSDQPPTPTPVVFNVSPRPGFFRTIEEIRPESEQVIDVREPERFAGNAPEAWPGRRRGHIPGSLNLHYEDLMTPERTFKSPDELRQVIAAAGVDLSGPIVATCGSGVTACILSLALTLVGRPESTVYDGSWAEWGLRLDKPVAIGRST
ncbi:MAG: 3-mercaptopyruvate sulfurtransferase [Rhodospirillaceae bacterium]|nr:3-mercaptopyruvate sulfurtransferase [Rhodospirillaceae bacterium]